MFCFTAVIMLVGAFFVGNEANAGAGVNGVVLNEVMPNPAAGNEWIEVINTVSTTWDLSGCTIEAIRMEPGYATQTIALSGTLPDHGILVFEASGKLDNAGAILTFRNELGIVIYSMSYGDQNPGGMPHADLPSVGGSAYYDVGADAWYTSSTPQTYGWFNGAPAPTRSSIVADLNGDGITTNFGTVTNPSAASGVWFEMADKGRLTFNATLNYTSYATKVMIENLASKLDMSATGTVAFDASTAADMQAAGAEVTIYSLDTLGFTTQPYLQIMTDYGAIIPPASSTYPTISGESYAGGELTFSTDHFTGFGAYKVVNTRTGEGFNTLQQAVSATNTADGDTLNVSAETFAETVNIDKSLTFSCSGGSVTAFTLATTTIAATNCGVETVNVTGAGSVQEAVDIVKTGGTINAAAGSYDETVTINKALSIYGTGDPTVSEFVFTAAPILTSGISSLLVDVSGNGRVADGLAATQGGGTLTVYAGTYNETVTFDHFVHLLGSGSPTVTKFILDDLLNCSGIGAATVDVTANGYVNNGIECVSTGGTVNLAAHTYGGNFVVDRSMTIKGASSSTTIITDLNENMAVFAVTADNVTIQDLTVQNAPGRGGIQGASVDYLTVMNVISTGNTYGIELSNSNFATLTNVELNNNSSYGLYVLNSNSSTMTGSVVTGQCTGIKVDGDSANIQVHESKIYDNSCPTTGLSNDGSRRVDASQNWWGATSGPWNASTNPGGEGNPVSDNVVYRAFYTDEEMTTLSTQSVAPSQINSLIDIGTFLPPEGSTSSTTANITVQEDTTITLPNGSSVFIPKGTVMTRTGGGNFDATTIDAESVSSSNATGLATGSVVDGVLKWGADLGLTFSQPITVTIYVGTSLNGRTLTIKRSSSLTEGWTNAGIVDPPSCVVADGLCTFQATMASYYSAYHVTQSGSSGGGGGGGKALLPPVTGEYQSYTNDPDREKNLANLAAIGFSIHDLVKLADDGNPDTQIDSAVYYIGADGRRHAFPNASVYFTWYANFSAVKIISAADLASVPLGKNVRYKPGVRMIKFATSNKVYAISLGGALHWVTSEEIAKALYGDNWNTMIDDVSDIFYTSYFVSTDINAATEYDAAIETGKATNISVDLGL